MSNGNHRGQHSLVYFDGTQEQFLPLIGIEGQVIAKTSSLSNWDRMTMRFQNSEELLRYYQKFGCLPFQVKEYQFYLKSRKPSKPDPTPLQIAYQDDYLLSQAIIVGENRINTKDPFVKEFLNGFISDLNKGSIITEILHPMIKRENVKFHYIDPFLREKIKYILYAHGDGFSEQNFVEEMKEKIKKDLRNYLENGYKRFRGVYFFYRDFQKKHPRVVTTESKIREKLIQDRKEQQETAMMPAQPIIIITDNQIDELDRDPYTFSDSFDRPEVPIERPYPIFIPDSDKYVEEPFLTNLSNKLEGTKIKQLTLFDLQNKGE